MEVSINSVNSITNKDREPFYFNNTTLSQESVYDEQIERNNLLIQEDTWKRLFIIKWKSFYRHFKLYLPLCYFWIISYGGSTLGAIIFRKYIQPVLEGTKGSPVNIIF